MYSVRTENLRPGLRVLAAAGAFVLAVLMVGPAAEASTTAGHAGHSPSPAPPRATGQGHGATFNGVPLGNGGHGHPGCSTRPGPNGSRLSICHPGQDPFVPNINGATQAELLMATELFKKVQAFCKANPTATQLTRSGFRRGASGNHWHNKNNPISFDPDRIRTAITEKGGNITRGTAFRTANLPRNSLIRWHPPGGPTYTFHAWCADNLTDMLRTRPVWKGSARGGGHSH